MTALLITPSGTARLHHQDLANGLAEKWLQDLLFRHPELVPLDQIEPGTQAFIPVVRELTLFKPSGSVFLDLFGVTPFGRPVLIECKLWRNPQARREVVAQIMEYAALLRRLTYADLIARLRPKLPPALAATENPLFELAHGNGSTLSEAAFTDAVAANLRQGDFHLIIAGDGIREDMLAIAEYIGNRGARLALVEFQRWSDEAGNTVVVPHVPFRTQLVRQRLLVDVEGAPIRFADEDALEEGTNGIDPERTSSDERSATAAANRAFWQAFIDQVRFDHPDQPAPRHGGNNWVRIPLPSPARWITAYRWKGRAGLSLVEEQGSRLCEHLVSQIKELQEEIGPEPIRLHALTDPTVGPYFTLDEPSGNDDQLAWLLDAANRMVSALRPRLSRTE